MAQIDITAHIPRDENSIASSWTIEQEEIVHSLQSDKRFEELRQVLHGTAEEEVSMKYISYVFGTIAAPYAITCFITLIPVENLIENPQYWFESMLQLAGVLCPLYAGYIILNCSFVMNIGYIQSLKHFTILWLTAVISVVITCLTAYLTWTYGLKKQWPIPFLALVYAYTTFISQDIALWYRFPKHWRNGSNFSGRFKFFLISFSYGQIQTLLYGVWSKMFLVVTGKFQWMLAVLLPIFKEINIWMTIKLASRCTNGDNQSTVIACTHIAEARHSLFLAYTIGGAMASFSTEVIMLATDFLTNVCFSIRIACINRKNARNEKKQMKLLIDLVIAELVELTVPLIYLLSFCTAYFGPVGVLFGNVKIDYWHHRPVQDFGEAVENVVVFFFIDASSLIVCSVILWTVCRINLYRVFIILQEEFGVLFAMNLAPLVTSVSKQIGRNMKVLSNMEFYNLLILL